MGLFTLGEAHGSIIAAFSAGILLGLRGTNAPGRVYNR